MAKISTDDLKKMGFAEEMFVNVEDFNTFLTDVIDEQAEVLEAEIGSTLYASETKPTVTLVKRAEKCLVAFELYQRRFNAIAHDIDSADGIDAFKLRKTQTAYQEQARQLIDAIKYGIDGATGMFSSSVAVSSHFAEDA